MRLPEEPDIPAQINIVPMIDVIFAILTFFIMSTLFLTRSEGLPVNLPQATTATATTKTPVQVTLTLDVQGKLSLNRESIQLEDLEVALSEKVQPNQDIVVLLNADEAVNHGKVMQVMDRVRRIPGAKLAIATKQ
jgi:biopolymer transport protein ExbD